MVLAGALAGLFVGIFFGDDAKVLQPVGDIYVKLLEVAVYPYFKSPLAVFLPRERVDAFRTRSEIVSRTGVRIGVFNDPVLVPRVKRIFPNAQIVLVPYYNELPDFSRIDAAVWTLAQAEAIAAAHPELAAVQPSDAGDPYLFAYLMPPDSEQLANFVNYWLQLKRTDGSEQQERDYWIKRLPRENASARIW